MYIPKNCPKCRSSVKVEYGIRTDFFECNECDWYAASVLKVPRTCKELLKLQEGENCFVKQTPTSGS